ncbi:MAG: hypothetical protein ABIQ31_02720 [Ferruginibacter sp.]
MKSLIVIFALTFLGYQSQSQKLLKIAKAKYKTYNTRLSIWNAWPDSYTYFQKDAEPILKITKLDDEGVNFSMSVSLNGSNNSFTVSYKSYNSKNNWYIYEDASGDQICVVGATLSYLAQNSWPSNLVQIYFWIDSENYALLLE